VRMELAANNRAEALGYLRRYTPLVGDDFQKMAVAADWNLRLGRLDDAVELAERVKEKTPSEGAERGLRLVHLRRGDPAKAVTHLEQAGKDPDAIDGLVRGYLALGKLASAEQALKRIDRTVQLTPELRQARTLVPALVARRLALRKDAKIPAGKAE